MQFERNLRHKLKLRTGLLVGMMALCLGSVAAWVWHSNDVLQERSKVRGTTSNLRSALSDYVNLQHLSLLNQASGHWAALIENRKAIEAAEQRFTDTATNTMHNSLLANDAQYQTLLAGVIEQWQALRQQSGELLRADAEAQHLEEMLLEITQHAEQLDMQINLARDRLREINRAESERLHQIEYALLAGSLLMLLILASYIYRGLLLPMLMLNSQVRKHERELEVQVEQRTSALNAALRDRDHELQERTASEERFQHLATHDLLTNLPNRMLLLDRLRQLIRRGEREHESFAVLLIDLNNFKTVNDAMGHHVGDELLLQIAHRLRDSLRDEDTLARLGGDEFVALLPGVQDDEALSAVNEKILSTVAQPCQVHGHEINPGCSMGVSLFPRHSGGAEELLKFADIAMYAVKESALRHGYAVFDNTMAERVSRRHDLEKKLRQALRGDNEFELYYQPQVDIRDGKVLGAEALLRWKHAEEGYISPGEFIPVAEESGLIGEIGTWVLRTACHQLADWQARFEVPHFCMAINVSAQQMTPLLPDIYRDIVRECGIDPSNIELEITESQMMENPAEKIALLRDLAATGAKIAVDDFGTGYSSLSYLTRFSIHRLKVDQSFVRNLNRSADYAVASTIVAMAHSLKLEVIAEGIEHLAEAEMLDQMGCSNGQGYLFGRPAAAAAFEQQYLLPHARPAWLQ